MNAMTPAATLALAAPLGAAANVSHAAQPTTVRSAAMTSSTTHHAAPQVQARREASYRAYYHNKFGAYPSQRQVDAWYARTYGAQGS